MADGTNREDQAAAEFAWRWIAAVQAMGNQIQRQQETFQQMSQQLMEQAEQQQQAFQQLVQQSLAAYMERLRPSR